MKNILIAIVLVLGFATSHAEAQDVPIEIDRPIHTVKLLSPITAQQTLNFNQLNYQPFPFDPMGSHSNLYAPRNCTWGVASMKPNIPQNWGNANQWDDNARAAGITVSDTPIVGSVGVDNSGYYGHVVLVTAVYTDSVDVTEMNYDYNGSVRTYNYPISKFVYLWL